MSLKPHFRRKRLQCSDAPTARSAVNGFAILSQPPAPQVRRLTKCYAPLRFVVTALFLSLISSFSTGEERYDQRTATSGVLFSNMVDVLKPHTGDHKSCVLTQMGVSPDHEADVHKLLLRVRAEMEAEINAIHRRIGCEPNAIPEGDAIFAIYDEFGKSRRAVFDKYLAIAAAEVSRYGYFDLREMMTHINWSISGYLTNHRSKRYSNPDFATSLRERLKLMCEHIQSERGA